MEECESLWGCQTLREEQATRCWQFGLLLPQCGPGTVLYCTVLYCTVLYCTVLCCAVLYCTVLHQILSYYSARADDAGKVTFRKVLTLFILLFIFAVTLIARRQRRMILRAEVRSKVRHLTFLTMQVVTYVAII